MSDTKHGSTPEGYELKPEELEGVVGGRGGSPHPLPPKKGCDVYRIESHDTLKTIARHYGTTVCFLLSINPTIRDKHDITAGYYIYVPEK